MAKLRHLLKVSILALTFSLSACGFDLGEFNDDEGYEKLFDSFGDAKFMYDGGLESFDYEDSLLNDYTLEHFDWEDSSDSIDRREYLYIVLPVEEELSIEAFAFFVYSDVAVNIEMSFFYFEDEAYTPNKIKYLSSPDTEEDPDTGEQVPIEYDDPLKTSAFAVIRGELIKEEWTSFACEGFRQAGSTDGHLHTEDGGLIYIRMENNSGFNKDTMTSVSFSFLNLLIRAVQKGK